MDSSLNSSVLMNWSKDVDKRLGPTSVSIRCKLEGPANSLMLAAGGRLFGTIARYWEVVTGGCERSRP